MPRAGGARVAKTASWVTRGGLSLTGRHSERLKTWRARSVLLFFKPTLWLLYRRPRPPSSSSSSSSWTGARCRGGSSVAAASGGCACMGSFYYMKSEACSTRCVHWCLLGILSDTPSRASTRALWVAPNLSSPAKRSWLSTPVLGPAVTMLAGPG